MSYHIYTTKGIILSSRPLREADRVYSIMTEELGLVRATATGVRKELSKLRGALEPFSLSTVSFVRGKEYWRLTSAILEESLRDLPRESLSAFARVFALLEKLVQGEEKHEELFKELESAMSFAQTSSIFNADTLEIILALRILFHLGYISKPDVEEAFLTQNISLSLLEKVSDQKKSLVARINTGINESGLG